MVVIKLGNTFFDIDKNVFNNILEMQELILPFEWHSFCISIDLMKNSMKLYHNDHLQAVQNFTIVHGDKVGLRRLMTKGHLGGQKFVRAHHTLAYTCTKLHPRGALVNSNI